MDPTLNKVLLLCAVAALLGGVFAGHCLARDVSDEETAAYLHKLETESVAGLEKVLQEKGGFRAPDSTVAWEFHFQRDSEVSCWASFRESRSTGKAGDAGSSGSEAWYAFNLYYLDIFNLQHSVHPAAAHGIQVSIPTVCTDPCVSVRDQHAWLLRPMGLEQSGESDRVARSLTIGLADPDAVRTFIDALATLAKTCGAQRKKDPYLPR